MKSRKHSLLLFVMFVFSLMQGCPRPWQVLLYNNSAETLSVYLKNGERTKWEKDTLLRIGDGCEISWDKLSWVYDQDTNGKTPTLVISNGSRVFTYFLLHTKIPLGYEYMDMESKIAYRMQLEKNYTLYVLKAGTSFPAKKTSDGWLGIPVISK